MSIDAGLLEQSTRYCELPVRADAPVDALRAEIQHGAWLRDLCQSEAGTFMRDAKDLQSECAGALARGATRHRSGEAERLARRAEKLLRLGQRVQRRIARVQAVLAPLDEIAGA